jgi:hypothetical protein
LAPVALSPSSAEPSPSPNARPLCRRDLPSADADTVRLAGARDSQRKWRQAHPDYLRQYLAQHAQAVEQNRQRQQLRDQKRRIRVLEKNNLAWDLKRSTAEVWLVGPRIKNLEKNNLASAQVLIFQPVKQQQLLDGDA